MNYLVRINVLWVSRIALVLLLGLSGLVRTEAQEMGCEAYPISCVQDQYLLVKYYQREWPRLTQQCKDMLLASSIAANTCNASVLFMYSALSGVITTVYIPQAGMKAAAEPKELTDAEASKLPGLSKFKPFAGGDKLNLRIKDQLLVSTRKSGTTNSPGLCASGQSCGTAGQWTIKPTDAKKKGTYTISQTGKANACLSYSSAEGLAIKSGTAAKGSCTEWVLSPNELGTDGEIKSYQIRPLAQPDHVLVLDSDAQQLQVVSDKKVTPDGKDATAKKEEPTKLKAWTINPASKTSAVNTTGQTQKKTATQK